jgi:putative transposase
MILPLHSRGMTTRDIQDHLAEVYGVAASPASISTITEVVIDEITLWQNRPTDEVYPIVYVDAIRVRVRDKGAVTLKAAYLVVGVDVEGRKHWWKRSGLNSGPAPGWWRSSPAFRQS